MPRNRPHPERSHRRKATTRGTAAPALRLRTLTHPVTHGHTRPASSRWFSQRTSGFIPRADAHNQHASTRIALVREQYTTSQLVQYPPKWCNTTYQQAFARTCTAYTTREGPMLHQFVRQCDTTVDRSTSNTARMLHPLRGTAPDQNGCNAYGSGAPHTQTRTNAESESPHHTRHRRTGEKSPPTPGAPSTTRNNRTQARTLTHLVATWAHPCACEPTWWQHRHTRPASGKWG